MQKRLFFLIIASFFLLPYVAESQVKSTSKNLQKDSLTVGIAGSAPFLIYNQDTDEPEGIAIEIWENLAQKRNWNYNYQKFQTVEKALNALENGKLDLVAGPISITSQRIPKMHFSQPFYQSSLAIASRNDEMGFFTRVKALFSFKLLYAVGVFLFILSIVGTLFWFAERKASPEQFPADPKKGIGNGMWLAIVTMSTTGYGDMAPVTLRGRIIAGSWMVITLIFATSMIAGIASTLTLTGLGSSTVTTIEELSGKKTATISGSPAEPFIKEHKSKVVSVNNINQAMEKLHNKKVDAVIYDRPQLLYYQKNDELEELYIAKAEYYKQGYGFAFPLNSKLIRDTNLTLLELSENQTVKRIIKDYLGD
jgi:polar amino acid transport system substrate-binding protein